MAKKQKAERKYGDVEGIIKNQVIDSEYLVSKQNSQDQYNDYESILDMIELVRSEKNYDWKSDIFIPLMISHLLTDSASWANRDFASRDFVDIYLEGDKPEDKLKAKAAKKLINNLLNLKDVYHYHKLIRARSINWLFGQVYALMWWEQKIVTKSIPQPPLSQLMPDYDQDGQMVTRKVQIEQPDKSEERVVYDRMNYEVFDARNVFTDFSYTYSAQQKPWITLRSQKRFSEIKNSAEKMGYFNIEVLEEKILGGNKKRQSKSVSETSTSKETFNKIGGAYSTKQDNPSKVDAELDILDRYGTIWAVVTETDEDYVPMKCTPGYSSTGEILDKAELVESIITYAGLGDDYTMIGFRPTWAVDSKGQPFKPIIRGWCYIHPTKDIGLSDGKNLRELNIAANDTFNLGNDRDMLATLPVLKGRRDAVENNPTVFIQPKNVILLENPEKDLTEMVIRPNNGSNMRQMGFIKSTASEADAIWPTTMGGLPEKTSTTATAVAGAENRTGARSNLKDLNWNYTFDVEFYQMMLQLAYRFMNNQTVQKILGEDVKYFEPDGAYTYVPVNENLESEHNKLKKVGIYDQMNGRLAGLAKIFPKEIAAIIAYNTGKQAELMGSEYQEISHLLEALTQAKPQSEEGAGQVKDGKEAPASNQNGIEQSSQEQDARLKSGQ